MITREDIEKRLTGREFEDCETTRIRNDEIFDRLQKADPNNLDELWSCLFDEHGYLEDERIPPLRGGLARVDVRKNWVEFLAIGSREKGGVGRNSFVVERMINEEDIREELTGNIDEDVETVFRLLSVERRRANREGWEEGRESVLRYL